MTNRNTASGTLREVVRALLVRGSCVPRVRGIAGAASILSLGTVLLLSTSALAGDCTPGPNAVCSAPASPGVDTTETYSPNNQSLTITTQSGFGLDGAGIEVTATGAGDVRFLD